MKRQVSYGLTDHACRSCGGRILVRGGAGGGGNPVFECADCGIRACDMGPESICWCGFHMRHEEPGSYYCERIDAIEKKPWLRDAFTHCGVDVFSGPKIQIGMMNREMAKICEDRWRKVHES